MKNPVSNMKETTLSFIVSFLLLFGCNKSPTIQQEEIPDGLMARTDSLVYSLDNGYTYIQLTIENGSDSTAWFFHCGERFITIINRFKNNNWEEINGWGWPCLDIYSQGIIPLSSDSNYFDSHQFNQTGHYRFSFLYNWEYNIYTWSDTLYSNEFNVR